MAFTSDYTGDQLSPHRLQDNSPPQYSLQSQLPDTYLIPHSQSETNHWSSSSLSYEYGSRNTSAQRISPISIAIGEMATTINEGHQVPSTTKELESSQCYSSKLNGHFHGYGQPSNPSTSTSSSSFQTDICGNGNIDNMYPINNNFTSPLSSLSAVYIPSPV